jgi:monofunctional biosynthetic peptidoglycan transglycosylase
VGISILRGLAFVAIAAIALLLALQFWYLAHLIHWREHDPPSTAFIRAQQSALAASGTKARIDQRWVGYDRISVHLKRAVIAAEDANFPSHEGVDWDSIDRALERNVKRGKVVGGGSTITMQLAKNLFLSSDRSYWRKAQEVVIAFMIERVMTKRRILEIYLNVAEWGVGVFGAEAAARHHFGVTAAQLGPEQAARLAAMLPRPRYYDRHRDSAALARRSASIQRWMSATRPPP